MRDETSRQDFFRLQLALVVTALGCVSLSKLGPETGMLATNSQWLALALLLLTGWTFTSEQLPGTEVNYRYVFFLLALGTLLHSLTLHVRFKPVKVLARAVDQYGLSTLGGVYQNQRLQYSSTFLVLSSLSLPLERAFQRQLGYSVGHIVSGNV